MNLTGQNSLYEERAYISSASECMDRIFPSPPPPSPTDLGPKYLSEPSRKPGAGS